MGRDRVVVAAVFIGRLIQSAAAITEFASATIGLDPVFTEFRRVFWVRIGFYLVLPSFVTSSVSSDHVFTGFFYRVLPSLFGATQFYRVLAGSDRVLLSFTSFYLVLPSFT